MPNILELGRTHFTPANNENPQIQYVSCIASHLCVWQLLTIMGNVWFLSSKYIIITNQINKQELNSIMARKGGGEDEEKYDIIPATSG
jgi:hypothetical protein